MRKIQYFLSITTLITIQSSIAIRNTSYSSKISQSIDNSIDTLLKTLPCTIKDLEFQYDGLDIVDPAEKFRTCIINAQKPLLSHTSPDSLKVTALQLENFDNFPKILSKFPNLALLKIINSKFLELSQLCSSSPRLKIILLHNVTVVTRINLNGCNRLTYFAHETSGIESIDNDAFHDLTQLSHLSLRGNSISELGKQIFEPLKNLAFLQLSDNRLKSIDGELIKKNGDLLYVDLSNNPIEEIGSEFFENDELKIINMRMVKCYSNKAGQPINWQMEREKIKEKCHHNYSKETTRAFSFIVMIIIAGIGAGIGLKRIQEKRKRQREVESYNNFL